MIRTLRYLFRVSLTALALSLGFGLTQSPLVHAQSGGGVEHGRGGDVIKRKDGTIILADEYLIRSTDRNYPGKTFLVIGTALERGLRQAWRMMIPYGADESFLNSHVFENIVDGRNINIYRSVDSVEALNAECRNKTLRTYELEDEKDKVMPVACSIGRVTFIVHSIFFRLSAHDRVRSILHERLGYVFSHDGGYSMDDHAVMNVTTGLKTITEISERQFEQEDREPILASELTKLERMKASLIKYFDPKKTVPRRIGPHGGVVLSEGAFPKTFVSVGSSVGLGCAIDQTAEIIASRIDHGCYIGPRAQVIFSEIRIGKEPPHTAALHAQRLYKGRVAPYIGAGARIAQSTIVGLIAKPNASIDLVKVSDVNAFIVGRDSRILDFEFSLGDSSDFSIEIDGKPTRPPFWNALESIEFQSGAKVGGLGLKLIDYGQSGARSQLVFAQDLDIDNYAEVMGKKRIERLKDWSNRSRASGTTVKTIRSINDLE